MHECSKAVQRRLHDPRFITRFFRGDGIDIGAGNDPLVLYHELFPAMTRCDPWDVLEGNAETMIRSNGEPLKADAYDFVHASHVLEHMADPWGAVENWTRILKPGGYLVVLVPEWTMYEQQTWPSKWNSDHKRAWTLAGGGMPVHPVISMLHFAATFPLLDTIKLELLDATYRRYLKDIDQTQTPVGECAIEWIAQKRAAPMEQPEAA
jgi:SAM-dependent methyltransferase